VLPGHNRVVMVSYTPPGPFWYRRCRFVTHPWVCHKMGVSQTDWAVTCVKAAAMAWRAGMGAAAGLVGDLPV
jgi:hypothetical protein